MPMLEVFFLFCVIHTDLSVRRLLTMRNPTTHVLVPVYVLLGGCVRKITTIKPSHYASFVVVCFCCNANENRRPQQQLPPRPLLTLPPILMSPSLLVVVVVVAAVMGRSRRTKRTGRSRRRKMRTV